MAACGNRLRATLLFVLLLTAACGEEKADAYIPPGTGNGGNNNGNNSGVGMGDAAVDAGGTSGGIDAGGNTGVDMDAGMDAAIRDAGMDAGMDAGLDAGGLDAGDAGDAGKDAGPVDLAPEVTVLAPAQASDPDADTVIVEATMLVQCRVAAASPTDDVNASSVVATVYEGSSNAPKGPYPLTAQGDDVYSANVSTTGRVPGVIRVRCSGSNSAVPPKTATDEISTFFDLGPTIEFSSPAASATLRAASFPFVFDVVAAPLAVGDDESAVASITAQLNGSAVDPSLIVPVDGIPNRYRYTVTDFGSGTPPMNMTLQVQATNQRGGTRRVSRMVNIDGVAPSMAFTLPAQSAVVAGVVTIRATVNDSQSGVEDSSVIATIDANEYPMTKVGATTTYEATFQAGEYPTRSQLVINLKGRDKAGNEGGTDSQTARTIYLDTQPPWISLDPPDVRELFIGSPTNSCTEPFDPVGSWAVDDGDVVEDNQQFLRAVVWERTNPGPLAFYAGLSTTSVALFVQRNNSVPLVTDSALDADSICDAVNENPSSPQPAPVKVGLAPITQQGSMFRQSAMSFSSVGTAPDASAVCSNTARGASTALCTGTSDMYRAIAQPLNPIKADAVYGISPGLGASCTGSYYESSGAGGWRCVVAVARDTVGNLGISMPLRYCIDLAPGDCTGPAPSCTDGCTMPTLSSNVGMPLIFQP